MRLQAAQPQGWFPSLRQQCRHTGALAGPLSKAGTQAQRPNLHQAPSRGTGMAVPSKGGNTFQETLL